MYSVWGVVSENERNVQMANDLRRAQRKGELLCVKGLGVTTEREEKEY